MGQLLAGHHVAGPLEHQTEDFERLLLQADPLLPLSQLAGAHIELE